MDAPQTGRVDWVDYAKGFCIVMVVMMHSTLGVEAAAGREGWMHALVAFAKPFRMPDFFLISGLFLARVIDRDWRDYLDRKVVHFVYFYVLWVTIQFAFKAPMFAAEHGLARRGARLSRSLHRAVRHAVVHLSAADLLRRRQADPRRCRWMLIWLVGRRAGDRADPHRLDGDRRIRRPLRLFLHRLHLRDRASSTLPRACSARPRRRSAASSLWGIRQRRLVFAGTGDLPFVSLALGLVGAAAVVAVAALMAKTELFASLRYCGANSIVIYLAFFLPMAATRTILLKTGIITDLGTVSLIVTTAGVIGALVLVLGGAPDAGPLPVRAAGLGETAARAGARHAAGGMIHRRAVPH